MEIVTETYETTRYPSFLKWPPFGDFWHAYSGQCELWNNFDMFIVDSVNCEIKMAAI